METPPASSSQPRLTVHQNLSLNIDLFEKTLTGCTELIFEVFEQKNPINLIRVNLRQCEVLDVKVEESGANYTLKDPVKELKKFKPEEHLSLKKAYETAVLEGDLGELLVHIPELVQENLKQGEKRIKVCIKYQLDTASSGIYFVNGSDQKIPHIYTAFHGVTGVTRLWTPCIDQLHERYTWQIDYFVPSKHLNERLDCEVISIGQFLGKYQMEDSDLICFRYEILQPVPALAVGFVAGGFKGFDLKGQGIPHSGMDSISLSAYCLSGWEEELLHTCSFYREALAQYSRDTSFPYPSYKIIFVEDAWTGHMFGAGISVFSSEYLCPRNIIDQLFESRRALDYGIAVQYFGVHIVPQKCSDTWLIVGLARYLSAQHLRLVFGNNDYRFRLRKDIERTCELDVDRLPIGSPEYVLPPEGNHLGFISLKAPLVLHILDVQMRKNGPSRGVNRIIREIVQLAMRGELGIGNSLSTSLFFKLCKKYGKFISKKFEEQWIFGSGCPCFDISYTFNRKHLAVEFEAKQSVTNLKWADKQGPARPKWHAFTGHLVTRVLEANYTPYEHVVDINKKECKFEVPFNTKYTRIRLTTGRGQTRQEQRDVEEILIAKQASEEMLEANDRPWEKLTGWQFVKWGEKDTESNESREFAYIRTDAEVEWICQMNFTQKPYMWSEQLKYEKEVIAQLEAVQALSRSPSEAACSSLLQAAMNRTTFYRVRMEAALAMAKCGINRLNWIGFNQLYKLFEYLYGLTLVDKQYKVYPRSNDFNNFKDYFVKKAVVYAFSMVRDDNYVMCPLVVVNVIKNLLEFNDNSNNPYSDCYYVATLIASFTNAIIPTYTTEGPIEAAPFSGPAHNAPSHQYLLEWLVKEIERLRTMDMISQSFHNVITTACLKALMDLMLAGLIPCNLKLFLDYSRYGNFDHLRQVAFDGILFLDLLRTDEIVSYLLDTIEFDHAPYIRCFVARGLVRILAYLTHSELVQERTTSDIEMVTSSGYAHMASETITQRLGRAVDNIREEFAERVLFRDRLWSLVCDNHLLDWRVRQDLLAVCQIIWVAVDQKPPTVEKKEEEIPNPVVVAPTSKIKIKIPIKMESPLPTTPTPNREPEEVVTTIPKVKVKRGLEEDFSTLLAFEGKEQTKVQQPLQQMSPEDYQECENALAVLKRHPSAGVFLRPVDPIRDQCPDYFTKVTQPMDLGTVSMKLSQGKYGNKKTFAKDVSLVFSNCFKFNRKGSRIYKMGKMLETEFILHWHKTPLKSVISAPIASTPVQGMGGVTKKKKVVVPNWKKKFTDVINKLMQNKHSQYFRIPVDPVRDHAPDYFEIIKKPVDLSTIKANVEADRYQTKEDFCADIELVFENCFLYNSEVTLVYKEGKTLQAYWQRLWEKMINTSGAVTGDSEAVVKVEQEGLENPAILLESLPPQPPATEATKATEMVKAIIDTTMMKKPGIKLTSRLSVAILKLLNKLHKNKEADLFSIPVDERFAPGYFEKISQPMDLGQIRNKLVGRDYQNSQEIYQDVLLMFHNCYTYNAPSNAVFQAGKNLQAAFEKLWHGFLEKPALSVTTGEATYQGILNALKQSPKSWEFRKPVDVVKHNIPHYHDIIKQPMDLSTMAEKLKAGRYREFEQFEQDFRLIVRNCELFNGINEPISKCARDLEREFDLLIEVYFPTAAAAATTTTTTTTITTASANKTSI